MRKYQKRCYAMVVTGGVTKGQTKATLGKEKQEEKMKYMSTILASLHPSLVSRSGLSCWKDEE